MEIQERKSELISRLSNVQSPAVLDEIEKILDTSENQEFDFETEWLRKESPIGFSFEYNLEEDAKNGLTAEEFKQEMFNRLKKLPWKK